MAAAVLMLTMTAKLIIKMRLVIKYHVGDGYTWNADIIQPIEYSSKEDLLIAFDEAFRKARKNRELQINGLDKLPLAERIKLMAQNYDTFVIAGHEFEASSFKIYDLDDCQLDSELEFCWPQVYTLDEWFEKYSKV